MKYRHQINNGIIRIRPWIVFIYWFSGISMVRMMIEYRISNAIIRNDNDDLDIIAAMIWIIKLKQLLRLFKQWWEPLNPQKNDEFDINSVALPNEIIRDSMRWPAWFYLWPFLCGKQSI